MDYVVGNSLRYFYFNQQSGRHYRTTYAMDSTRADVLVFGSSRASHHYVSKAFEDSLKMSFYNTGRNLHGIFYQTAVLKSILNRYRPKLIILDYAGNQRSDDIYDGLPSLLPYYKKNSAIRVMIDDELHLEKIKLMSETYPFNSKLLLIAIGNLELGKQYRKGVKGYIPLYGEWKGELRSVKVDPVDSEKLAALNDFITLVNESGAEVIVVYSPIFMNFNSKDEFNGLSDEFPIGNVPFWDFTKDTLFLNNSHFFKEEGHLNDRGAQIFSQLLVKKIREVHDFNE